MPSLLMTCCTQFDIELARSTADSCGDGAIDPGTDGSTDSKKKSLWLRIARHVVEKEKDVKQFVVVVMLCLSD